MDKKPDARIAGLFAGMAMLLLIVAAPFAGSWAIVAALLIFAACALRLPSVCLYIVLFTLFPMANIFKFRPDTMSLLTACELLTVAVLLAGRKMKVKKSFYIGLAVVAAYTVFNSRENFSLANVVKVLMRYLLIYGFFAYELPENGKLLRSQLLRYAAWGMTAGLLISIVLGLLPAYRESVLSYLRIIPFKNGLDGVRNSGMSRDPNYLGMMVLMTASLMAVLYDRGVMTWDFWVLSPALLAAGFTTYSKMYFLCSAAYVLLVLIFILFPKHRKLAWIGCGVLGVGLLLILSGKFQIISTILSRFRPGNLTTGRVDIVRYYMEYWRENPRELIFGAGYNVWRFSDSVQILHNLYLESLFRIGIVGIGIYVTQLCLSLPKISGRIPPARLIPLAEMLVMYMALAGLSGYEFWYYIVISAACVFCMGEQSAAEAEP